jgi:hypothetical protein
VRVTITNQARHLLICTLNSGRTLHLAPAERSAPVEHLEINGNEKIGKLVRTGLVIIGADHDQPETKQGAKAESAEQQDAKQQESAGTDLEDRAAVASRRRQRKERE